MAAPWCVTVESASSRFAEDAAALARRAGPTTIATSTSVATRVSSTPPRRWMVRRASAKARASAASCRSATSTPAALPSTSTATTAWCALARLAALEARLPAHAPCLNARRSSAPIDAAGRDAAAVRCAAVRGKFLERASSPLALLGHEDGRAANPAEPVGNAVLGLVEPRQQHAVLVAHTRTLEFADHEIETAEVRLVAWAAEGGAARARTATGCCASVDARVDSRINDRVDCAQFSLQITRETTGEHRDATQERASKRWIHSSEHRSLSAISRRPELRETVHRALPPRRDAGRVGMRAGVPGS